MASSYILVLDAGTSAARCLVFDRQSRLVAQSARAWSYRAVPDASPLAREFDPAWLWGTFCQLAGEALKAASASGPRVAAISVTSQRQAVAFLASDGSELYVGPSLDLRAVFEGAAIDDAMRERVYRTTGHVPSFFFAPAKLRWFQLHRPEACGRIASVLTLADWLVWRLTGVQASEPTLAGEAGLLDIHRRRWCADLMDALGLPAIGQVLLLAAGTRAGRLPAAAAEQLGLPAGVPVFVAGADTQCGLLGLGIARPGQVGIVAGWSAPLQMVTSQPVLSPQGSTWAGCFLTEGAWVLEGNAGDVGNAYRWLAEALSGGRPDYCELDRLAATVAPGAEGVVGFLGHARMDMAAVGMRPGGFVLPVPLTYSEVGRGHLVRAALEGFAFAIRANLEQVERLWGGPARTLALGGGMTRTPTFVSILKDVLGRETGLSPVPQASALGACLCARVGLGDFRSLEEAAASMAPSLQVLEPDEATAAEYQEHYQRWLQVAEGLKALGL